MRCGWFVFLYSIFIFLSGFQWTALSENSNKLKRTETLKINGASDTNRHSAAKRSAQIQGAINSGNIPSGSPVSGTQAQLNTGQPGGQTLTPFVQATTPVAVQPVGQTIKAQPIGNTLAQPLGQSANIVTQATGQRTANTLAQVTGQTTNTLAQTAGQAPVVTGQPPVSAPIPAASSQGKTVARGDSEDFEEDSDIDQAADDSEDDEMDSDDSDPELEAPCIRHRRRRRCRRPYRFRGRRPRRPRPLDDGYERNEKQNDWLDFRGDPGYFDQEWRLVEIADTKPALPAGTSSGHFLSPCSRAIHHPPSLDSWE